MTTDERLVAAEAERQAEEDRGNENASLVHALREELDEHRAHYVDPVEHARVVAALEAAEDRIDTLRYEVGYAIRTRDEWEANAEESNRALARVEGLFAGGPDTVCQTVWRNEWGVRGHIECVEVPMDDLRAALAPTEACGCPDSRDCCERDADLTPITGGLDDAPTGDET